MRQSFLVSHLIPLCGLESAHARQRSSKLDAALAYSQISHFSFQKGWSSRNSLMRSSSTG